MYDVLWGYWFENDFWSDFGYYSSPNPFSQLHYMYSVSYSRHTAQSSEPLNPINQYTSDSQIKKKKKKDFQNKI